MSETQSDIVERLKRSIRELERLPLHTQMLQEAVDEIERSRAALGAIALAETIEHARELARAALAKVAS
jgi:hypothetical protein